MRDKTPQDARGARAAEVAAHLRRELRGDVRDDAYTRHLFATDASMYAREPLVVAFPRDADDVAAAIAAAARFELPVVTRGAGTSLAGQTIGQGIVLDTSRHMAAIRDLDPDALRVRVEPGVVQEDLNRAAQRHGLGFGPDTSTSNRATIGGMIGNNSSGSHSIVYGTTLDHVHALEVVLSDGSRARFEPVDEAERERRARAATLEGAIYRGLPEIVREHRDAIATGYPDHWRQSGGYSLDRLAREAPFDLARFVAGSEGTLVAITEATVGLVPLPQAKMFAVGHFDSLAGAIAATDDALALDAAAIELLDKTILDLSRRKHEYRRLSQMLEGDPEALLFVTFFADAPEEARDRLDRLEDAWRRHGHGYHTLRAESAAEQDALTKVRKAGLGLLMAASTGARRPAAFVEDTAVAPERLGDYVARFRAILDRHGLTAGFYGHCSVGCLHIRPFVDLTQPGEVETMRAVAEEIVELVAEFDGVNSSEHGDGLARSAFNPRVFGDELYEAFRKVKALFDPHGRLNPGVMVDAPADDRAPARPRAARAAAAADAAVVRRARRHARRGRPLPAHRRLPQDRQRRDVPVLHGHARGGARDARARQRAREGALLAGPARRARRRAAARDPRPLPRVQGVQERVPAERRHGVAEVGVPLALPGHPRRAAALAAVRRDPAAEPRRRRARAGLEPARARARGARAAGAHGWASRAGARCRASRASTSCAGTGGARRRASRRPRRRRLPRRLLHHVHRARDRPRGDRAARGGRLARAAGERRLLRAREHLQGPARPGARHGRRDDRPPRARTPSAACRSSAASRPAC